MACMRRKRLEQLKAMGDPIAARAFEAEARPRSLAGAREFLALWRKSAAAWPAIKPWIDAGDVAGLVKAVRAGFRGCKATHPGSFPSCTGWKDPGGAMLFSAPGALGVLEQYHSVALLERRRFGGSGGTGDLPVITCCTES